MIKGVHVTLFTNKAEAVRAFIRDELGLDFSDPGDGWLLFDVPEVEIGVHPTGWSGQPDKAARGEPYYEVSFYCDDLERTIATLKNRGVDVTSSIRDDGWGLVTTFRTPGGFEFDLYQPKYTKKRKKKGTIKNKTV